MRTLTEHIETNLVFRRVPARLFTVLGPLLLMLAAIGIYAVVSYTVSLRTTEIGVRIALGATVRGLIAQFVGESLVVVGLGALVGWALSLAVAIVIAGGPDRRARVRRRAGDPAAGRRDRLLDPRAPRDAHLADGGAAGGVTGRGSLRTRVRAAALSHAAVKARADFAGARGRLASLAGSGASSCASPLRAAI